jgi:hypothetical protein
VGAEHLFDRRLTDVGTRQVFDMVQMSVDEYNREVDAMMASFVQATELFKERFMLPGDGTLEPLSPWGHDSPDPRRPEGYYDVAYPLQGGGFAWGDNRVSRAKMTVEEANENTLNALMADADWLRRHVIGATLYSSSWTFGDEEHGDLTIECLADGGTETYPKKGGSSATDDHYLAQAASIDDDNNPFQTIYDELMEHPSNSGPVVVYAANGLKSSIQGLTSLIEPTDDLVIPGTGVTTLSADAQRFVGFGEEIIGVIDGCLVVNWRALPAGYMIAHAVGGGPVLKMRRHPEASLQGLFTETNNVDGNFYINRMIRYAGFGVFNRIAAVAYNVGNASYTDPTAYNSAPLPV